MSLVLAIEPDAGQARQLAHIAQQLRAELVVVNTTAEVFMALDGRAPDLVLVPALLSPKEEATLAEALRAVAGDAPVRLLTKPTLSTAQAQAADGLMANLRKKKKKPSPVPDGCDPATFAEQMAVYLGEAGKPAPPAPESVAPPPAALAKTAPPPAVESPLFVKAAPAKEPVPLVKAAPAKEPAPVVKAAPAKAPVPSAKRAPRVEPWPLAPSSLVTELPSPAEPLSTAAEPPAWTSLESLFINAAEHPPVQDPPPSPELTPLPDPLFSTAAEPPAWSSIESLFINAAGHPPVQDPPPSPEPAPLADPLFSAAEEPPAWPSLESLFINAAEHPPVQETSIEAGAAPSWTSHVSQPDTSFDIGVAVASKEITAAPKEAVVAAPNERVRTVPVPAAATGSDEHEWRGLPDEREWRDLVASFQRAVNALEIEKWLAVRVEPAPAAGQPVQPAKPAGEPCDEWGFYDPARYGLSAVLDKIDRMDGSNKHTR
jgi:CheY-like chemotaxis protein